MSKFLLRFFILLIFITTSFLIYLSYFGVETDKFDSLIKSKANEVNKHVKLDFKRTKIHINPKELNLAVKLQNPKILVKGNEIILSKLDLFLPLRSFFTSDFLLKRAEVAFKENDIKDLTKITYIFLPKFINKKLNKIFAKGSLEGEFVIPFQSTGKIGKNYGFTGKVYNSTINLTNELSIKNLTTEINHSKKTGFTVLIKKGSVYDLELSDSRINLRQKDNKTKIKSVLHTKGELNFPQIKKIISLLSLNINDIKDINSKIDLETEINFDLDKKFRLNNLLYSTKGNILKGEIDIEEKSLIKRYLPDFDPKIIIKDIKVEFIKSKLDHSAEFNGFIKSKQKFNSFQIKEVYNSKDKSFNISGVADLTNSKITISKLNYYKDSEKKSELDFNVSFVLKKYLIINKLNFLEDKTKIYLSNIKLSKNFEIENFNKLEIITFVDGLKNNDFLINKKDKIVISGNVFDAQPLLKSLFKKSGKKTFSKNFTSQIKINFSKTLTGTNDDVSNFAMIAFINKGSFDKLSLKGNFSEEEIIEMSIYKIDNEKKSLQVISDRARPFIKNFDFVKGFEGGKLEYESIISKKKSESNLLITDFKVSKVPALAQLLTLASLQGIADTLSGEGIRFDSFEMKSNSEGNILNIEDALAMGPAVSILLNGYVDKGKIVSLRGTLVPATKLNAIIASIPVVGDILVGKKTGEGVVGVSFKMKGPPKNIKTSVNPIKTLTPRFIVRAIEKMKKKKKEEVK